MNEKDKIELEIKQLIEGLTNVLDTMNHTEQEKVFVCEETLGKLKKLNVDPEEVRQIIRAADFYHGNTTRYRTSEALYETFDKLKNI